MYLSNQELLSYHLSVSVRESSVLLSLPNSPAYLLITTLATSPLRFPILLYAYPSLLCLYLRASVPVGCILLIIMSLSLFDALPLSRLTTSASLMSSISARILSLPVSSRRSVITVICLIYLTSVYMYVGNAH